MAFLKPKHWPRFDPINPTSDSYAVPIWVWSFDIRTLLAFRANKGPVCLFVVVLCHNNSMLVISCWWYDVWDEKEKAWAYNRNLSLTSHTIKTWYERNWPLMTLWVIHSEEMDCIPHEAEKNPHKTQNEYFLFHGGGADWGRGVGDFFCFFVCFV